MRAIAHANKNWANLNAIGNRFQAVLHTTGRFRIGENKHVSSALKPGIRQQSISDFRIKRCIHGHFAFIDKVAFFTIENFERSPHAFGRLRVQRAELGV